ncbi:isoprenyl transferase [Ruania halotolerans]|uniref:isoprenyl transferase n=1 Tax=Ruania halotolerans TaxID=2897773 RepID=UPI001E3A1914|nr:isoprenyl transferase [Ruania halotolerans]UFU07452.1 isoprenyl transferase [Ruania halotolerans]
MRPPAFLYGLYERRLTRSLDHARLPHHVGVMLDGNRRWARSAGLEPAQGHQAGADRIVDLLGWCEDVDIKLVTLWMLSTNNLDRDSREVEDLLEIIAATVATLATTRRWRLQLVGELDLLPEDITGRMRASEALTRDVDGIHVNIAVGYGGRHEIAGAVRALIAEYVESGRPLSDLEETVTPETIAKHLYTKGQPDPDLVIRTSGEQRLGGFLLWQSAQSEFYFCEAFWPDFRRVDFLRALRSYGGRERRLGR